MRSGSLTNEPSEALYPLARNQYINNSPRIFSCIRPGVNTCAACICTEINSPKIILCIGTRDVRIQTLYQYRGQGQSVNTYFKNNSSKIFSCIRPHMYSRKNNSSRIFSCMYRFCAGGQFVGRRPGGEGEADSRVGSAWPVPNKPLTRLDHMNCTQPRKTANPSTTYS